MQYRKSKDGKDISILGFGCMRFKRNGNKIDEDEVEKEILYAIKHGINYFDTAYIYPGSEETLGKILNKHNCRKDVYIATKLPQYVVRNANDFDKFFDEELRRLKTDYIDFYLLHMLGDVARFNKLKELGLLEWIDSKIKEGKIHRIGFSYHGNTEMFKQLIDIYNWDFCQIQYNYLDEFTQAGRGGLEYAYSKNIPVIIMEPLRGGRLVEFMPESAKKIIYNYPIQYTLAELAFRWLWDQKEVTCVLSGMNSMAMLEENIHTASNVLINELTSKEFEMIEKVKSEINRSMKVGCTNCRYCMPCPKNIDIPLIFASYNRMYSESKFNGRWDYLLSTSTRKEVGSVKDCINCKQCENHCPQHIEIRKNLKVAESALLPPYIKFLQGIVRKFI